MDCSKRRRGHDQLNNAEHGRAIVDGHLRVAVSGIHVSSSPSAGAAVAKLLGRSTEVSVVGLVDSPQSCALAWDMVVKTVYLVPGSSMSGRAYVDHIIDLHRTGAFDLFVPCTDDDIKTLCSHEEEVVASGLRVLLPPKGSRSSLSKERLSATLTRIGLPVARASEWSKNAPTTTAEGIRFPVVVKGPTYDAYAAADAREMAAFAERLEETSGGPVIIQEYLEGSEFSIAAVADRAHQVRCLCALRKIGVSEKGKTWAGCTIDSPDLESLVGRLVSATGWVGPLEVECIQDPASGTFSVIEVNPRLPAWVAVAAAAGSDLTYAILRILDGQYSPTPIRGRSGVAFVRMCTTSSFPISRMAALYTLGRFPL